jgi:hypothetical protein
MAPLGSLAPAQSILAGLSPPAPAGGRPSPTSTDPGHGLPLDLDEKSGQGYRPDLALLGIGQLQ